MKNIILIAIFLTSSLSFGQEALNSVLFVIDISGSMSGAPIRNVKGVIDQSLNKLPNGSYGGLVSFNGCGERSVKVEVPISLNPHSAIRAKANSLSAGGSTDLVLALKVAGREAAKLPGVCTNIILLTDGMDSCSSEKMEDVAASIAKINVCSEVNIISMGIAENWEKKLLDDVAAIGGGQHKAKKDSKDVLQEVVKLMENSLGGAGVPGWSGDYKDSDGDGPDDDDDKGPPPKDNTTKTKEKKTNTSSSSSKKEKAKNGKGK